MVLKYFSGRCGVINADKDNGIVHWDKEAI